MFHRSKAPRAALIAFLGGLLVWGCGARRTNLLIVVVDTLRADHVGVYGSYRPTTVIDSLAHSGTWWEHVYTPSPRTTQAMASIMTGLYPQTHGVRVLWGRLTDDHETLAELLLEQEYATAAVVTNHMLDTKSGLNQGFEYYDVAGHDRNAAGTTDAALRWLESAASHEPFFLWVHYLDPHMPYAPPPSARDKACDRVSMDAILQNGFGTMMNNTQMVLPFGLTLGELHFANPLSSRLYSQIRCLYEEEVHYSDREIGRLFAFLRQKGLAKNTIIVLTADHGEALGEHGLWCDHGNLLHEPEVRVPLMISGPGIPPGEKNTHVASLLDIFPTLLGLLGLSSVSPEVEGVDLFSDPDQERLIYLESGACFEPDYFPLRKDNASSGKFRAVTDGVTKLVWYPDPPRAGDFMLLDLNSDPAETVDVLIPRFAEADVYRERLSAWLNSAPEKPPGHPGDPRLPGHDEKDAKRLKALGYLQ